MWGWRREECGLWRMQGRLPSRAKHCGRTSIRRGDGLDVGRYVTLASHVSLLGLGCNRPFMDLMNWMDFLTIQRFNGVWIRLVYRSGKSVGVSLRRFEAFGVIGVVKVAEACWGVLRRAVYVSARNSRDLKVA